MSDGGKGSAPRLKRDDEAYASNYERIFGKKTKDISEDDLEPKGKALKESEQEDDCND